MRSTTVFARVAMAASLVACMTGPRSVHHAEAKDSRSKQPTGPFAEDKEVSAANRRGDLGYLERVCSGQLPIRQGQTFVKKNACAFAKLHKETDAALHGTCGDVVARFASITPPGRHYVTEMAVQFAKCDKYAELFEQIASWGSASAGEGILRKLAEQGLPIEAKFLDYARTHAGAAFLHVGDLGGRLGTTRGLTAIDNITSFLLDVGSKQHCSLISRAVVDASVEVRLGAFRYFSATNGCPEAIAVATGLLTSNLPSTRIAACQLLGHIGKASVVPKLKILADSDGYSTVVVKDGVGVKVYPVRDACGAAAGKIALRK